MRMERKTKKKKEKNKARLHEFRERRKESVNNGPRWSASHWKPGADRGGCIYVGYQSDNSITGDDNAMYALITVVVAFAFAFANRPTRFS